MPPWSPAKGSVRPLLQPCERSEDQQDSFYLPVRGGEDHCRSICSKARVHSDTHAWLSFSMPDEVGLRPPHMTGLAACWRACFWINPLWEAIVVSIALMNTFGNGRYQCSLNLASSKETNDRTIRWRRLVGRKRLTRPESFSRSTMHSSSSWLNWGRR